MHKCSGSQFFKTTTGIQSGSDASDKSRLGMTFLTNLGVKETCSFRYLQERKTDKVIPQSSRFEFLEKVLANTFALLDTQDNTSGQLNRGDIAALPLLRTL